MSAPIIYQARPDGIWDGVPGRQARPDPMTEGEYLIPGGGVLTAPPALAANQAARLAGGGMWTSVTQQWDVVADFVGLTYWLADRTEVTITEYGVTPPDGYLTVDPGPPPPTTAQLWSAYKETAQAELDFGDKVCTRCTKAGVAYPAEWLARDEALRTIIRASSGDPTQPLPTRPAFPANT